MFRIWQKAVFVLGCVLMISSSAAAEKITLSCTNDTRARERTLVSVDTDTKTVRLHTFSPVMDAEFKDGRFGPISPGDRASDQQLQHVKITQNEIVFGTKFAVFSLDRVTGILSVPPNDSAQCALAPQKPQF